MKAALFSIILVSLNILLNELSFCLSRFFGPLLSDRFLTNTVFALCSTSYFLVLSFARSVLRSSLS